MADQDSQRLDKWLWAARFFKTRSLAAEAVSGGKVHVDDQRVKPARPLRPGQQVRVRKGEWEMTVIVRGLAATRGPAPAARLLYEETADSARRREDAAVSRRTMADHPARTAGRPSKRDRRRLADLRKA